MNKAAATDSPLAVLRSFLSSCEAAWWESSAEVCVNPSFYHFTVIPKKLCWARQQYAASFVNTAIVGMTLRAIVTIPAQMQPAHVCL